MINTYNIDFEVARDMKESIDEYLNKQHLDLAYIIDFGEYGIHITFNTNTIRYSLLTGIYSILKDYGYTRKGNKNKQFDIRKRDKEHRVLISYEITEQLNHSTLDILIIPQVKEVDDYLC